MKVIISIAGRYRGDKAVEQLFAKYAKKLKQDMERLSKDHKFKLPGKITLRPMYVKGGYYPYHGRAQWCYEKGWEILLNLETCRKAKDEGMDTLAHECAHIADYILHGRISHGDKFKKLQAAFSLLPTVI